ncbi:MAG: hypothetical protein K2X82_06380 [Gemmataceae bacterium]|nr:hypothetical protein [Gemmataceae bacterium]
MPNVVRAVVAAGLALAGVGLSAAPAAAQQNLFNVPTGKITERGELFFQQQLNFARPVGSSNTTFDLGLGRGWEVGVNALDLLLYDDLRPAPGPRQTNPDLLVNFQKGFELVDDVWSVGVGSQLGFNPARTSREVRFQAFTWLVNTVQLPDDLATLYAGPYYANVAYGGPGDRFGGLFGVEVPVWKDKFHFQADYITGNRDVSVAVVGGVIFLPRRWQLSVGAQLPTPRSGNPYGVVFELTQPGFRLWGKPRD